MSYLKIIEDLGTRYPNENSKRRYRYYNCQCICGEFIELRADKYKSKLSCGCMKNRLRKEVPIGEKFSRLTILEDLGMKNNERYVLVSCECDINNTYEKPWHAIRKGMTQSCGCLQREKAKENMKEIGKISKHGKEGSRLYKIWDGMKQRCSNPKANGYKRYGGRGIEVCKDWQNDFQIFYEWAMSNGYQSNLTIDRINNNGNYEPSNCQWLTKSENTKKMHKEKRR